MANRRGVWAASVAAVLALSAGVIAQQPKGDPKKQDEGQKQEIQAVVTSVDSAMSGQPAGNDFGVMWVHEDFMKAASNKEYVPFVVSIDPSKVAAGTVAFYWRVAPKGAVFTPPAPPASGKNAKKDKNAPAPKRPEYAYEDISFIQVAPGAPIHVSRSMTLPAGDYDVYVAVKEPTPAPKGGSAPQASLAPKTSVIKQSLTVPNFWTDDLATSSVLIAQRIDPLPAPLTPQQQVDRPYALGGMEIIPALDTKLSKKSELSTFMLIYNPKVDGANKPDILVEYSFCQVALGNQPKAGEPCKAGEKFFNKTAPQSLNAGTLPPQFDLAAGHQVQTGQAVPLASFPEGDYRLEIKVTDKIANKSITRDVNFTVTAS